MDKCLILFGILFFGSEIFASPSPTYIFNHELDEKQFRNQLAKSEWYKLTDTFNDLPRYFGKEDGCSNSTQFYLDCNLCQCPDHNPDKAMCTDNECLAIPQILNWKLGKPCPRNKLFFVKCNHCVCDPSGLDADCTNLPCLNPSQLPGSLTGIEKRDTKSVKGFKSNIERGFFDDLRIEQLNNLAKIEWYKITPNYTDLPRYFDAEEGCKESKEFYLDCNRCTCANGKHSICTQKACLPTPQIVNWKTGLPCPANRSFYHQCEDCTCDTSGRDAECVRVVCANPNNPENPFEVARSTIS